VPEGDDPRLQLRVQAIYVVGSHDQRVRQLDETERVGEQGGKDALQKARLRQRPPDRYPECLQCTGTALKGGGPRGRICYFFFHALSSCRRPVPATCEGEQ